MTIPMQTTGDEDVHAVAIPAKDTPKAAARAAGAPAATSPVVIGIDLSLVSTGVAGRDWVTTIGGGSLPKKGATLQQQWTRIRKVRSHLVDYIDSADLVVLEAPSFGSNDPSAHERAALWWIVVGRCLAREIPLAVVAPATLKVYATGSGRAAKEDVVQAVASRLPQFTFRGNDQADAITLAAMGYDHLGEPLVELPKSHRRALDSVTWPEVRR